VRCESIADRLPGVIDGRADLDRGERRHIETCLACQAELARYRKLLRTMHQLRFEMVPAPPGLLGDVLNSLEDAASRSAVRGALTGRRAAYIGGIAAAATAAAAGAGAAVVIVTRGRRQRLLAS